MDKKEVLASLGKELNYYRTEYEWKVSDNKTKQILQVINDIKRVFKDNACDLSYDDIVLTAKKETNICTIKPSFDYSKEPKSPRQFSLQIIKDKELTCDLTVRLFIDESTMESPNLSNLLTNPYKGMDSDDIEIVERKKSIAQMKEFIETEEDNSWHFLCTDNLKGEAILFTTLIELYDKKVDLLMN